MAKWQIWHAQGEDWWNAHLGTRHADVQAVANKFRMDTLYRLKSTGECVYPVSYPPLGGVIVRIEARFNPGKSDAHDREVMVSDLDDLEECDLPAGVAPYVHP